MRIIRYDGKGDLIMKYIVVLGDGMADLPIEKLGGKTPLRAAHKPTMDMLASRGEMGMVKTVPDGMAPGSDVANLSVMGYNPKKYYTGRSPLEAVSIGAPLKDGDVTYRVNTVTLSGDGNYETKVMADYSADEITSAEGAQLIDTLQEKFGSDRLTFYAGTSYRNLLVMHNGSLDSKLTPPHDISKRVIGEYLPKGDYAGELTDMMKQSYEILKEHPVNKAREQRGLHSANSIWFWGQGSKPALPSFKEKYGLSGAVISAVDLLKGIGHCAKMDVIEVEGATGNVDTNFTGKANAALAALLGGTDFVYLHVEAADECGHRGEVENKVLSIERLDAAAKIIIDGLKEANEDFCVLLMPDHPTPIATMTHSSEPVPYVIYRSNDEKCGENRSYCEAEAAKTGIFKNEGYTLMDEFLAKK